MPARAAQVLPALLGAVLGIFPGGYLLLAAIITISDGDSAKATLLGPWQLIALVLATVLTMASRTSVPASTSGRGPLSETLQTELAGPASLVPTSCTAILLTDE